MKQFKLVFNTQNKQLMDITSHIRDELKAIETPYSGMLNLFIQHTSASLLIQENADLSAKSDLLNFFELLAPEGQKWHQHVWEGADDTTSHMRASVTPSSLNIPIVEGELGLGVWQGIYLFEHRKGAHSRQIIATVW